MFDKLRDLIFGFGEFEKTKLEIRFEIISTLLSQLVLRDLSDFQIVEDCEYKIREQLRVKSSNLNRVIRDPSKKLTKRQVNEILDRLEELKQGFLNKAFDTVKIEKEVEDMSKRVDEELNKENVQEEEIKQEGSESEEEVQVSPKKKEDGSLDDMLFGGGTRSDSDSDVREQTDTSNSETDEGQEKKETLKELELIETKDYKAYLENGKIPYIMVEFKDDFDMVLLSRLSSALFESRGAHGTNILTEGNKALIIPRIMGDSLISIPRIEVDLGEVYEKIHKKTGGVKTEIEPELSKDYGEKEESNKEEVEEVKEELEEAEKEADLVEQEVESHEGEKVAEVPKQEFKDGEFVEIKEPVAEIKTKKKEEESLDELISGLESKEEPRAKVEPRDDKEEPEIEEGQEVKVELNEGHDDVKVEETAVEVERKEVENHAFEIYKDEQIVAYLNPKTKAQGELLIERTDKKPLGELSETEFSYMTLFAKAFGGALFEVKQAHGTNVIWDYNSNVVRIVPRYENDNLGLNWQPRSTSPELLDQVREKLLKAMQGEKPEKKEEVPQETDEELEDRARRLLEAINRIP